MENMNKDHQHSFHIPRGERYDFKKDIFLEEIKPAFLGLLYNENGNAYCSIYDSSLLTGEQIDTITYISSVRHQYTWLTRDEYKNFKDGIYDSLAMKHMILPY